MTLVLLLSLSATAIAFMVGLAVAWLAGRPGLPRERAHRRLQAGTVAGSVAVLLAFGIPWLFLHGRREEDFGSLLIAAATAFGAIPAAFGIAIAPAEAVLRGRPVGSRARIALFLLVTLFLIALWTGWPVYALLIAATHSSIDAPMALIAAPLAYGLTLIAGRSLAPLAALALLGRGRLMGGSLPRWRINDLGQFLARVLLVSPGLRPALLVSETAARELEPQTLDALARIEEERQRLGYPRRRLAIRLMVSVLGSIAGIAAWARYVGTPPFAAYFLLPALLDAWVLLLSLPLRLREDRAADRAADDALGGAAVRSAIVAADSLETPATADAAPSRNIARRLAALDTTGPAPRAVSPISLLMAGLASLIITLTLARMVYSPNHFDLGEAALAAYDLEAAEHNFREFLRQHPQNAAAATQLAWTLAELGRDDEAREWGDRAVSFAPGDYDVSEQRNRLEELIGMRAMSAPDPSTEPPATTPDTSVVTTP